MKMKLTVLCLVVGMGTLAGCGVDTHESLSSRAKEVFDMGSVQMPRSDLSLHGYRVVNSTTHDHFVYVIERNGQPIQGAGTNYEVSSGKSTRNESVTSVVPPVAQLQPPVAPPTTKVRVKDGNHVEIDCGQPEKCTTLADELAKLAVKGLL